MGDRVGTSQQALAETGITNATVRLIARVTIPGDAVRIRLDNSFGQDPVKIGRAFVGIRVQGALLAAGSNKPITFGQSAEVTLPPGGTVLSDPVPLKVLAQQDLAISLFMPGSNVKPSQHTGAVVTSYRTADGGGDAAADEGRTAFSATLTSTWWLKAIDVQSTSSPGAGRLSRSVIRSPTAPARRWTRTIGGRTSCRSALDCSTMPRWRGQAARHTG